MAIAENLSLPTELARCIDDCMACRATCESTAIHCLRMGGDHAAADHQIALQDCAQICGVAADFMVRQSPSHPYVCRACAVACERCEAECRRLAGTDTQMLHCADICHQCAESCRTMSA